MTPGYCNVYHQESHRERTSPPHASEALADRAAERVWRATGGACRRVRLVEMLVDKARMVEVS